jgi:hypothetical protein
MDFGKLTKQVQGLIKKRGGTDALKDDAMELKDVATSKEGWTDKAQDAVEAVQDPGKPGEEPKPAKPASPS